MAEAKNQMRLLIVAHAPSPNTLALRDAVIAGASVPEIENVEVVMRPPLEAVPEDVLAARAIILGTTENLGYMSGALKDFFDRIYYPCLEEKQGMPFAAYIRAGQDGTGTHRAIDSIITGLRWRQVSRALRKRQQLTARDLVKEQRAGMELERGHWGYKVSHI